MMFFDPYWENAISNMMRLVIQLQKLLDYEYFLIIHKAIKCYVICDIKLHAHRHS